MKRYTVPVSISLLFLYASLMITHAVRTTAFVVTKGTSSSNRNKNNVLRLSSTGETEVEKLLRMAKELRAQAEQSEKNVHVKLADQKTDRNARLDGLVKHLFYGDGGTSIHGQAIVVQRLRAKKPSMDTLEKLVDRLDDLRDTALGYEHVETNNDKFERVSGEKNEMEALRIDTLTEGLLGALQVLDDEFQKKKKGGTVTVSELGHGGGKSSKELRQRLKEKRRERDEQFQERQKALREAQSVKKGKSKYKFHDEGLD